MIFLTFLTILIYLYLVLCILSKPFIRSWVLGGSSWSLFPRRLRTCSAQCPACIYCRCTCRRVLNYLFYLSFRTELFSSPRALRLRSPLPSRRISLSLIATGFASYRNHRKSRWNLKKTLLPFPWYCAALAWKSRQNRRKGRIRPHRLKYKLFFLCTVALSHLLISKSGLIV